MMEEKFIFLAKYGTRDQIKEYYILANDKAWDQVLKESRRREAELGYKFLLRELIYIGAGVVVTDER